MYPNAPFLTLIDGLAVQPGTHAHHVHRLRPWMRLGGKATIDW
jgi:hypothetical protein